MNNNILNVVFPRILIILSALVIPVLAIKILFKNSSIDPLILFLIICIGYLIGLYTLNLSIKNPFIPYLFLQLIIISIFLDAKITAILGIDFKIYALVFGLGFITALYNIFKNFHHLWKNFPTFRLLLIFFLINIVYFLFYHSDFRNWYSNYIDIWLASPAIRNLFLKQGLDVFKKSFSETKYIGMYLVSLTPLISFTVGATTFINTKNIKTTRLILLQVIKILIISLLSYLFLALLFIILGYSSIGFHHGRLWGDFLGFGHSFAVYLSYYFLLLLGFKLYLTNSEQQKNFNIYNKLINLLIATFFILILLQINKTALISLTVSLISLILLCLIFKINLNFRNPLKELSNFSFKAPYQTSFLLLFLSIAIITGIYYSDNITTNVTESFTRISLRFSSFSTMNIRTTLWQYFFEYWYNNLSLKTFLFGFGIDASRETAFYLSSILAGDIKLFTSPLVHVHNLYIEIFYDYGLIAILYLGSVLYIIINNLFLLLSKTSSREIKVFSITSLSVITFFSVFSLTEILRIPIAIIFFSILGFLESLKYALKVTTIQKI